MIPSICAGSMPPKGCATYNTGTPRSGKMSRDMRASARYPSNAEARTITSSEIGRRNAKDTKFIVLAPPVALHAETCSSEAAMPSGATLHVGKIKCGAQSAAQLCDVVIDPTMHEK